MTISTGRNRKKSEDETGDFPFIGLNAASWKMDKKKTKKDRFGGGAIKKPSGKPNGNGHQRTAQGLKRRPPLHSNRKGAELQERKLIK